MTKTMHKSFRSISLSIDLQFDLEDLDIERMLADVRKHNPSFTYNPEDNNFYYNLIEAYFSREETIREHVNNKDYEVNDFEIFEFEFSDEEDEDAA